MDSQAAACTRPLIGHRTGQQIVVRSRDSTLFAAPGPTDPNSAYYSS